MLRAGLRDDDPEFGLLLVHELVIRGALGPDWPITTLHGPNRRLIHSGDRCDLCVHDSASASTAVVAGPAGLGLWQTVCGMLGVPWPAPIDELSAHASTVTWIRTEWR